METLAAGQTAVHRLHPSAKLSFAITLIVCTVSFGRYDLIFLTPYLFYPFVLAALAGLPYRVLLPRVLVALPFCFFTGLADLILNRSAAVRLGAIPVSFGAVSFATILLKAYLCVMAALILIATTPMTGLTATLRSLRVPAVLVTVFELTYRYIGVLLEELHSMTVAYKLRGGRQKALAFRHMGSFAGSLFLRGLDRAERVHAAMLCRGYPNDARPLLRRGFTARDGLALAALCGPVLLYRVIVCFM